MIRTKWFIISIILLTLLNIPLAGCQPQFQPGDYTDDLNRVVSIDKIPNKIVSFGPSITEILFALGLGEKVVGVSDFCDYPEEAKTKLKIGSAFTPSIEKITELEPDLVLSLKHKQLNIELESLGIKFLVLSPDNIDGIFNNIELIGKIAGAGNKAEKLISDMRVDISNIESQVEEASSVRVFFVVDATDPNNPWTSGADSFIDTLITMSGGYNVASIAQGNWLKFSMEQIVSSDPEIIIVQTMAGGIPTVSKEVLEEHPAWQETTAVKQGNILFINGDVVSRPGPRIVQGLEEMAKIIHPELFR